MYDGNVQYARVTGLKRASGWWTVYLRSTHGMLKYKHFRTKREALVWIGDLPSTVKNELREEARKTGYPFDLPSTSR